MIKDFAGKTAVITGGSRGLGKAMALALAAEGVNIVLAARDEEAMAAVAALAPTAHPQEPRLANISARALSGTGPSVLTLGFVIGPGPNKPVLIRAVGPTLTGFGVAGALADPVLTVFNSANAIIATNNDWGTPLGASGVPAAELSAAFARVGAFSLGATSRDSAVIVTLAPGNYTALISGANNNTGIALVEVYEVP